MGVRKKDYANTMQFYFAFRRGQCRKKKDLEAFQTKVNFLINNGWKLVGGVALTNIQGIVYSQAVSKSTIVS